MFILVIKAMENHLLLRHDARLLCCTLQHTKITSNTVQNNDTNL